MTNTTPESARHPTLSPTLRIIGRVTQTASDLGILGSVTVFLLTAAVAAHVMTAASDQNENMYVAASVMIRDKQLYKDFSYVQMPYLPIFYSLLYETTGTDRLLFTARAATCVLWSVAACAILAVARRLGGRAFSWCAFFLFATNTFVLRVSTECSNYVAPMACFNVALLLFVVGIQPGHRRSLLLASSGICAALAVGLKLYYVAVFPPLFVLAFLFPRDEGVRRRIFSGVLPLSGGFLAGITPALLIMFRDPRAFLFNNLLFHWVTARAYVEHALPIEPGPSALEELTLRGKASWLMNSVFREQSILLLFVGIAFATSVGWGRVGRKGWAPLALCLASLILAMLVVVYMTPVFPQYVAFPLPFAILVFAALHGQLLGWSRRANLRLALILAGVCFLVNGRSMVARFPTLLRPAHFVPMEFHRTALAVKRLVGEGSAAGPVATLMPIYPLEARLPIYDELSTGIFMYWIGDRLTEAERRQYVGTGPGSIERLLEERPPSAILVGNYPHEDSPFIRYAQRHAYQRFDKREDPDLDKLVLYVQRNEFYSGRKKRSHRKRKA